MPRGVPNSGPKSKALPKHTSNPKTIERRPRAGQPEKYTIEWIENEADVLREWIANDGGLYIGSFARQRGYSRSRLCEFCKVSNKFSCAMEEAKLWQEEKFLEKGLTKEWDATQVRYTMARVCGDIWKASYDREESDKDITLNINVNRIQD
jgi:hypothetical protein